MSATSNSALTRPLLLRNVNKVGDKRKRLLLSVISLSDCNMDDLFLELQDVYGDRTRLRQELWRAKRDGLVSNDFGVYSLNVSAVKFCSFVSREIKHALETAGYIHSTDTTTTHEEGETTSNQELIKHDPVEIEVPDRRSSNNRSTIHQRSSTDELHESVNGTSLGQIEHNPVLDPMKTGPPPPEIFSSSVASKWIPKSASERTQITMAGWMKKDNPSLETREIMAYFVGIYMKSGSTMISFNEDRDLAAKFNLQVTPAFRDAWAQLTTESRSLYVKPVRDRITGMQNAGITREFLSSMHQDWIEFQKANYE